MKVEDTYQAATNLTSSHKFAKNAIYNVFGFVVTFPILILLTPYMLKVLGKSQFGIWAIAGVVTSYAQLSDLGMTTTIVKFVAEHWTKKDVDRINQIVSTAFFSFAVVGGVVTIALLSARHFIVINLLNVPAEMQADAIFVVSGLVIIFYFNLLFSVYNAILQGIQRMDVTNAIMVVSKILRAMGIWFILAHGYGLRGLVVNSAVLSSLAIVSNIFWSKKILVKLRVNPLLVSYPELKRIFLYSVNIFASKIIALGQGPVNKIILALYGSLSFVSFYEIGWRVSSMVRMSFAIAIPPLLPASAELSSSKNTAELEKLFFTISRVFYLFALPVHLVVIVLAEPFVQVWLGDGYTLAARAIQFLLIGNLFTLLVIPQYYILLGLGQPQKNTICHVLGAGTNIILAILLIRYIGFYGVLIGESFSLLIASLYIDVQFRKFAKIDLKRYIQHIPMRAILVYLILAGSLAYAASFIMIWRLGTLLGVTVGFSCLFFIVFHLTGLLSTADKQLIINLIRLLRSPR